jgi:transposase
MLYSPTADASFSHSTHTIYLALELSRRSWLVALHAPDAAKIELHRLPAGDGQAVLALLTRIRTRVERRTGVLPPVSCCYEAGRDGFWLHRLLEAHGVSSHVMDPSSLQVDRRARPAICGRLSLGTLA